MLLNSSVLDGLVQSGDEHVLARMLLRKFLFELHCQIEKLFLVLFLQVDIL